VAGGQKVVSSYRSNRYRLSEPGFEATKNLKRPTGETLLIFHSTGLKVILIGIKTTLRLCTCSTLFIVSYIIPYIVFVMGTILKKQCSHRCWSRIEGVKKNLQRPVGETDRFIGHDNIGDKRAVLVSTK
jgi:hypothetical protein